jgi:hypothetical protein
MAGPHAPPQRDEAPAGDAAKGFGGDHQRNSTDILAEPTDLGKRYATLGALLALKGFSLHELAGGGFLIARWDRTTHCPDLHGVTRFARSVGATA